jgi:hypothetical protein
MLAIALVAIFLASPNTGRDFRNVAWGMTQAQVMAAETARPSEVREENGETVVKYSQVEGGELSGRLIYIFAKGKLVRAKYISDAEHSELNDFIVDFNLVEPILAGKYGKPSAQRAVWDSDLLQQERLPYLDQDRALPSDILPSDPNVGLSVAMGYLRLLSRRTSGRTTIIHALTGENRRITHQIEYRGVELEALESKQQLERELNLP